jgi:uncharacterized protein
MKRDADYWIERLQLRPHPEGGYFRETYRADGKIKGEDLVPPYPSDRAFSTAIYFLLKGHEVSKFHRLRSDEVWHYYYGSSLALYVIDPEGRLKKHILGPDAEKGETFQVIVRSGLWFGAKVSPERSFPSVPSEAGLSAVERVNDADSYTLIGCTLAPGFDFEDFELARREVLLSTYPTHRDVIVKLT